MRSKCSTSYLQTSHFCVKCYHQFLALIFLSTFKGIPWKGYGRVCKWNLKRTPKPAENLFLRKANVKFCAIFNMICLKVLLLIDYFDRRLWNTFKNILWGLYKRRQIFVFYKMRQILVFDKSRCGKCSLEIKLFINRHITDRSYLSHQSMSHIL